MEKKLRRELIGKVVSSTNDKTITVLVETYKNHPKYHKRAKSSKMASFCTDEFTVVFFAALTMFLSSVIF